MTGHVVFAKVGWMKYYEGSRDDDPGPIGGGKHNSRNLGGERFNFLAKDGEIRGFVHTGKKSLGKLDGLNLKRIDPAVDLNAQSLDEVLVVFLAVVPPEHHSELGSGTRVVGWYKNATVYDSAEHSEPEAYYNLETHKEDTVRIDWDKRTCIVDLSGEGGMSRTNIRYPDKVHGEPGRVGWMNKVLKYIEDESIENGRSEIEREEARFQKDPALRKLIENYAMDQAERYYIEQGYQVKREGKPFDLLCNKGAERLFVEVKGTMQSGLTILLTLNEKEQRFLGEDGNAELLVVREIQSAKAGPGNLRDGTIDIYSKWKPSDHPLIPFQFQCDLDKRRLTKTFPVREPK